VAGEAGHDRLRRGAPGNTSGSALFSGRWFFSSIDA
jgi:hypothetical protein